MPRCEKCGEPRQCICPEEVAQMSYYQCRLLTSQLYQDVWSMLGEDDSNDVFKKVAALTDAYECMLAKAPSCC